MYKSAFFFISTLLLFGCGEDTPEVNNSQKIKKHHPVKFVDLKNKATFNEGSIVPISISIENLDELKDTITVYYDDDVLFQSLKKKNIEYDFNTSDKPLGLHTIKIIAEGVNGTTYGDTRTIILFASAQPIKTQAEILHTHPHNTLHYTQGLEFYNGELWEGTGNYGQSIIAQLDLLSGKPLKTKKLSDEYFGEGITLLNDKIYQLTYKAGKCFVYDIKAMEKINTFTYSGEGWGLTNNDSLIIMSNGSHTLFFKDPETFETVKEIQAFSNMREFANLNELEWIDGYIYANIYTTNSIIKIDPTNGQVLEVIDCSQIVNDAMSPGIDVLNGIAYHKETQKIYITGKLWSKLYEVSFNISI